jgi:hypothetical protein
LGKESSAAAFGQHIYLILMLVIFSSVLLTGQTPNGRELKENIRRKVANIPAQKL